MSHIDTERAAADPRALGLAVRDWLEAVITDPSDEADIALEAALLEQGVMTPDEAICRLEEDAFGVIIFFEADIVFIDVDGVVLPCRSDEE